MVGPIFSEQIEVSMRHHALESGCFVVNATGWLKDEQIEEKFARMFPCKKQSKMVA